MNVIALVVVVLGSNISKKQNDNECYYIHCHRLWSSSLDDTSEETNEDDECVLIIVVSLVEAI